MPKTLEEVKQARRALVFEELFFFQYNALIRYINRKKHLPEVEERRKGTVKAKLETKLENPKPALLHKKIELPAIDALFSPLQQLLKNRLPFPLTEDQINVILEINKDLDSDSPSSRMIQGDVGCGKTLVAFFAKDKVSIPASLGLYFSISSETLSKIFKSLSPWTKWGSVLIEPYSIHSKRLFEKLIIP